MHVDFEQDLYKKENIARHANVSPSSQQDVTVDPFENSLGRVLSSV